VKKALVTGGSGYFGSLLVRRLCDQGVECTVFDLNDADDRHADVHFVRGDIRDLDAIEAAAIGMDVVFHNVAQVPLAKSAELFDSVNRTGTLNLLVAARRSGVAKVVYTSSSPIFGAPKRNPVTEDTLPAPAEAYGRAKLAGEQLCHGFAQHGLDVTIIRPRTIMGHGRLGIFQILFEWVREGRNIPVLGNGSNHYQFVHADDLADVCIRAGMRPGPSVYNCGTDRFGSMRDTLEGLCAHAATGSQVKSVPLRPAQRAMDLTSALGLSPLGPYHALMYGRSLYFDITKASTELGWQPVFSNAEMFADSYDWYLAHRDQVLAAHGGSHHRSAVRQGVLKLLPWVL
jgi:nucleoside-diphosphate-sugar epimerase